VPIREMLKTRVFLEPEETAVLCEVFDDVVKTLRIVDRQDVLTTLIARKLVELARAGGSPPFKAKDPESFRRINPWWPSGLSLPRLHDMLRAAACGARECALIVVEDVKADRRR
jgi:hypothetical protein